MESVPPQMSLQLLLNSKRRQGLIVGDIFYTVYFRQHTSIVKVSILIVKLLFLEDIKACIEQKGGSFQIKKAPFVDEAVTDFSNAADPANPSSVS